MKKSKNTVVNLLANTYNKTYLQSLIQKRQIVIAKSDLTLFFFNSLVLY